MACDWIKIEHATPEKPEVFAIAAALKISPAEAFVAVFKIWRWFDQNTTDGNARGVTESHTDLCAGCPGVTKAMVAVGWMTLMPNGLRIPNFEDHMSKSAKKRAQTTKRVQQLRNRNAHSVTEGNIGNTVRNAPSVAKALRELELELKTTPLPPKGGGGGGLEKTGEGTDGGGLRADLRATVKAEFGLRDGTREQGKRLSHLVREFEGAGATAAEITVRRKRLIASWGEAKATPKALLNHWGQFDHDLEPLPFGQLKVGVVQTYPNVPSKSSCEAFLCEQRAHEAKVLAERKARRA